MLFVFGAVAEQRHRLGFRKMLQEPQSEFLAVILDSLIAEIDRPAFTQFPAISVGVSAPREFPRQKFVSKALARAEIRHPNVVSVFRQAPASATRYKDSQTVLMRIDFGVNGLCFEHGLGLGK
jgi:hypothetical protein